MKIVLNGQPNDFPEGLTVSGLIDHLHIKGPLAVELNRQVCPKKLHTETVLVDNDIVEIVTIVGGG